MLLVNKKVFKKCLGRCNLVQAILKFQSGVEYFLKNDFKQTDIGEYTFELSGVSLTQEEENIFKEIIEENFDWQVIIERRPNLIRPTEVRLLVTIL